MSAHKVTVLRCDGKVADDAGELAVDCDQRFTCGVDRIDHTRAAAKRHGWTTRVDAQGKPGRRKFPARDYCEACSVRRQLTSRGHRILDDAIAFLKGEQT